VRYWKSRSIPGEPSVSVVVAAYTVGQPRLQDALMAFLYSLRAQTYPRWEALVLHDGPGSGMVDRVAGVGDGRISFVETQERREKFGHPWRQRGIDEAKGDWLVLTNADNYYAPVFLEWLLHTGVTTVSPMVHCDLVHSHRNWSVMSSAPYRGCLDLGAVMVRSDLARRVPFDNHEFHGDGVWIDGLRTLVEGEGGEVRKVSAALLTHN
jgi:glycosyltransferase involved in cell wall biosynthesis